MSEEFFFSQVNSIIKPLAFVFFLLLLAGFFMWRRKKGKNNFYSSTPVLDSFSLDLTQAARKVKSGSRHRQKNGN